MEISYRKFQEYSQKTYRFGKYRVGFRRILGYHKHNLDIEDTERFISSDNPERTNSGFTLTKFSCKKPIEIEFDTE